MIRSQHSSLRYLSAIVFPAIALLAALLLRTTLDADFLLPFVAAVFLAAWLYGLAPGLLATAISVVLANFALISPAYSLAISSPKQVGRLIAFSLICSLMVYLIHRQRNRSTVFKAVLAAIGEGIIATDRRGRVRFINPAGEVMTGWSKSLALGKASSEVLRLSHEKTKEPLENPLEKSLREGKAVVSQNQVLLTTREGTEIPIEETAAPIHDLSGKTRGAVMVFRDISRNRQIIDQASHSQKMDAVGRLASGVAGDFNNLLTIMTGYSELLRSELLPENPLRRFADEIQVAAERAAGVTRQLLAFSRGQVVQPRLLDLNAVILNMETMLRRLLGDRIEVVFLPGPALERVRCDPGQIEQIIVNLAMNSRDAMAQGGRFVIETANVDLAEGDNSRRIGVEPGSYVMMAVSDTGIGMDAETRSRLFEPFFTTKGQGKGTGLGLSIVYGIVKQNQGQITVYSQPGCGTIFEFYLPRTKESAEVVHRVRPARLRRGSETVLLVDDEDGVRKLCSAVLQANGYTVIEAPDGVAALAAYEKNSPIDLLLTDVVMPLMNGFELAERLSGADARISILYMSGYRDHPLEPPGKEPTRGFLHKPFTPETLLLKVRESLDARVGGAQRSTQGAG